MAAKAVRMKFVHQKRSSLFQITMRNWFFFRILKTPKTRMNLRKNAYAFNIETYEKKPTSLSFHNPDDLDYTKDSVSAVIQGRLYFFGGAADRKRVINFFYKISKLFKISYLNDECTFVEISARLNFNTLRGHAALAIDDGNQGLI